VSAASFSSARKSGTHEEKSGERRDDRRFILVTDIGLLVKKNTDGAATSSSFRSNGHAARRVAVQILARNACRWPANEQPTPGELSIVRQTAREKPRSPSSRAGDDVSFMPYARSDRALDFRASISMDRKCSGDQLEPSFLPTRVYRPATKCTSVAS